MKEIDLEGECRKYLESLLNEDISAKRIRFVTYKSRVYVDDVELFNEIAQSSKQNEMKIVFGGLFYDVVVPGKNIDNIWNVSLEGDKTEEFKKKYGKNYKINWEPLRIDI